MTTGHLECAVGLAVSCQRWALVAIAALAVADCLPADSAPTGQHLLSDRALSGVHFSPSEIEGIPSHLLVTGPAQNIDSPYLSTVADLYQVPADTASGTGYRLDEARLLSEKCLVPQSDAPDFEVRTDIRGRLLAVAVRNFGTTDQADPQFEVFRIDLGSGTRSFLGSAAGTGGSAPTFVLSPGRTRVLDGYNLSTVSDLEGAYSSLCWSPYHATFVGEDVYYDCGIPPIYQTPDLWRWVPSGRPELLAHNARLFRTFATDRGPRLILARTIATQDAPAEDRYLLFDPATIETMPLPFLGYPPIFPNYLPASPDGHSLIVLTDKLTLFNWTTSETQEIGDAASYQPSGWEWRPGRNELWLTLNDGTLRIWKPETGVTDVPTTALPLRNYQAPASTRSFFTRDGNYWFVHRAAGIAAQPGAEPELLGLPGARRPALRPPAFDPAGPGIRGRPVVGRTGRS